MDTQQSDQQLVERVLSGDGTAFEHLAARHLKSVYNFVYRMTGGVEETSDITQEVFIKTWKNLKRYNPQYHFKTWILSIAHNTAIDWLRKKKPTLFSSLDTEDHTFEERIPDEALLPDELFRSEESKKLLETVLDTLPLESRTIILSHDIFDMTFEEIAQMIGKPMNTVKSTYRRALLRLRKKFINAPK